MCPLHMKTRDPDVFEDPEGEIRSVHIIANWKMSMGKGTACAFVQGLCEALPTLPKNIVGIICPSFPLIGTLNLPSSFAKGAQTCAAFHQGPYTGEVSAELLKEMGCTYVIVGHSERRTLFGETNEIVRAKAMQAIASGLTPILCIGEPLDVYERGEAKIYLKQQLEESMPQGSFILAYEPLWAIGTGRVASVEDIQDVHKFLKELLLSPIPIVYGGSVTPENASSILALPDVAGLLVGGASLVLEKFLKIIRSVS
jgi:triosephosphate isomerase